MHYFFFLEKKIKRSTVNTPTADYGVVFFFREGHMQRFTKQKNRSEFGEGYMLKNT